MSTRKSIASRREVSDMPYPYAWPPESVVNPGPNFKWSRTVVFDFHEVIVKWTERFVDFVNHSYGYNIDPKQCDFYNMQFDPKVALTPEQFEQAFTSFARLSVGGYGDLRMHDGIKQALASIKNAGINVEIWTWTPGSAETQVTGLKSYGTGIAQRVTRDLIVKLGLPIDVDRDLRFMQPGRKKWEMAEDRIPLIVEDNPETAVSIALGTAHAAILVPESYNEGLVCPNVLRLSDRKHLARTVISFFKKLDDAGVLL